MMINEKIEFGNEKTYEWTRPELNELRFLLEHISVVRRVRDFFPSDKIFIAFLFFLAGFFLEMSKLDRRLLEYTDYFRLLAFSMIPLQQWALLSMICWCNRFNSTLCYLRYLQSFNEWRWRTFKEIQLQLCKLISEMAITIESIWYTIKNAVKIPPNQTIFPSLQPEGDEIISVRKWFLRENETRHEHLCAVNWWCGECNSSSR